MKQIILDDNPGIHGLLSGLDGRVVQEADNFQPLDPSRISGAWSPEKL